MKATDRVEAMYSLLTMCGAFSCDDTDEIKTDKIRKYAAWVRADYERNPAGADRIPPDQYLEQIEFLLDELSIWKD